MKKRLQFLLLILWVCILAVGAERHVIPMNTYDQIGKRIIQLTKEKKADVICGTYFNSQLPLTQKDVLAEVMSNFPHAFTGHYAPYSPSELIEAPIFVKRDFFAESQRILISDNISLGFDSRLHLRFKNENDTLLQSLYLKANEMYTIAQFKNNSRDTILNDVAGIKKNVADSTLTDDWKQKQILSLNFMDSLGTANYTALYKFTPWLTENDKTELMKVFPIYTNNMRKIKYVDSSEKLKKHAVIFSTDKNTPLAYIFDYEIEKGNDLYLGVTIAFKANSAGTATNVIAFQTINDCIIR